MEWHPAAAAACAAIGAASGLLVPRIIAAVPEPEPDPDEDASKFPGKVPYADLGHRKRLGLWCAVACAVSGGLIGVVLGWSSALPWLLYLLPVGAALAIIDYVTWYLPTRIIAPSYIVVSVLVAVAAVADSDLHIALRAGLGYLGLGGYYGLLWLISPRIMAFGDVRLGALIGIALGPFGFATVLASAFCAALVGVIAMLPMRMAGNTIARRVPFGPFLVVGALIAVLAGQVLAAT